MEMTWVGSKRNSGNRGTTTDYEVMVSVVSDNKKKTNDEWKRHRLNFTFDGIAAEYLESEGYTHLMHTPVAPNSDRIYFKFLKPEESYGTIKLTGSKDRKQRVASFSFDSQTEYAVVTGAWVRFYDLKFDKEEKLYYIDGVNPKLEQRRWV